MENKTSTKLRDACSAAFVPSGTQRFDRRLWMLVFGSLVLLFIATSGFSQSLTISTLAGYAGRKGNDGEGSNARFHGPRGIGIDNNNNLYVADTENHTIRKITPTGVVSTIAGLTGVSGTNDGVGVSARFFRPQSVACDRANGILYVADTANHTIRRIAPDGSVSTLAGFAGASGNSNGSGGNARFNQPQGIAVDNAHNIYVADYGNNLVRKINSVGNVSTFAAVNSPQGIAIDNSGYLYVCDYSDSTIVKLSPGGVSSIVAGTAGTYGSVDGTGTNASFYYPAGIAVDVAGNLFVADSFNSSIRIITSSGLVRTLAGAAGLYGTADGFKSNARFYRPEGIAIDSSNNVFVADTQNGTVRKINTSAVVTTFAGSPSAGATDNDRGGARFFAPGGIAADSAGNVYVADAGNHVIRKISPVGVVGTLAGAAGTSGTSDGNGANARFNKPQAIAVATDGNVFVADTMNSTVRKISSAGVVSTLAGSAGNDGSLDGVGTNALFFQPQGIAVDNSGNVIVADTLNHTIRKVSGAGVVTTIAGLPENPGSSDGTNSKARFNWPMGVAVDATGNIFVCDYFNHTVRKIAAAGTIWVTTTIAGWPGILGNADGTNNTVRFFGPRGIVTDSAGNLYVTDSGNQSVRKITAVGTNWVVSTVAGEAGNSGSADGLGNNARFSFPSSIAIDGAGHLYIADCANNTIRVNRILPPQLQVSASSNRTVLSWTSLASSFVLETTASLSPPVSWSSVNGWMIVGDNYVFTNNVNGATGFYRLRHP